MTGVKRVKTLKKKGGLKQLLQGRKKLICIVLTFIMLTLVFSGCTKDLPSQTEETQTEEIQAGDRVAIGHVGKPGNLLLYLAKDLGYFAEEGIDAELKLFETDEDGINAVISGEIDAGSFKTMPELLAIDAGEDLKVFGGGQQVGSGILTLEENDRKYNFLKNYRDGMVIGTIQNSMEDVLVKASILRLGLGINKEIFVTEFNSKEEVLEAIKNEEVDAGALCLSDLDKTQREGLRLAIPSFDLLEKHPTYTQITKASYLEDEEKLDIFYRYSRATIRAYKYYLENPDETVDIILNYVNTDKDMLMADIYDENKEFLLEHFWPNPNPIKAYNWKFLEDLQTLGYLKSDKDIIHDYTHDPSYVDAMNKLAEETEDPVYLELKSIHVC